MKIISARNSRALIRGKKVLLRLDCNVPLKGARIASDFKLQASLPTLKSLLKQNCSLIVVTHLGEPKPGQAPQGAWSIRPIASWFSRKLGKTVFVCKTIREAEQRAKKLESGQIIMLENIRCFVGETDNKAAFARKLASLADIFINDAFAVSHRDHASVSGVQKFLPSFAGPLLEAEILHLERARHPKKPLVLVIGGAKISTKLPLLKKLAPRAAHVLIGGGVANTFLAARGLAVGNSLYEKNILSTAKKLLRKNMILPVDLAVNAQGKRVVRRPEDIKAKDEILDIGPSTIRLFETCLKKAATIAWNGPVGLFEKKGFDKGSKAIAQAISRATRRKAYTVIGGGETVSAAGNKKYSWVSTGGGAALSYLGGENLPGLKRIVTL